LGHFLHELLLKGLLLLCYYTFIKSNIDGQNYSKMLQNVAFEKV